MIILLNRVGEPTSEAVTVLVPRADLWKGRWEAVAEDGTRIQVEVADPLKNGSYLYGEDERSFRIEQISEEVLAIPMPSEAEMAAKIGWYLGNRHMPIEVRPDEIVLENYPGIVDSLQRIGIAHEIRKDVLNCRPNLEGQRH